MGPRDNAPLPEDAVPAGRHTDRPAGRERHAGEAGQEQAEAHHDGAGREAGQGVEGSEIRRVFRTDTGKLEGGDELNELIGRGFKLAFVFCCCILPERTQERVRRSDLGRPGTARATEEETV